MICCYDEEDQNKQTNDVDGGEHSDHSDELELKIRRNTKEIHDSIARKKMHRRRKNSGNGANHYSDGSNSLYRSIQLFTSENKKKEKSGCIDDDNVSVNSSRLFNMYLSHTQEKAGEDQQQRYNGDYGASTISEKKRTTTQQQLR